MAAKLPWDSARIAKRLQALAEEHGTPNYFQLSEVANGIGSKSDILAISRIARLRHWAVNQALAESGLSAWYIPRSSDSPAYLKVEAAAPAKA